MQIEKKWWDLRSQSKDPSQQAASVSRQYGIVTANTMSATLSQFDSQFGPVPTVLPCKIAKVKWRNNEVKSPEDIGIGMAIADAVFTTINGPVTKKLVVPLDGTQPTMSEIERNLYQLQIPKEYKDSGFVLVDKVTYLKNV